MRLLSTILLVSCISLHSIAGTGISHKLGSMALYKKLQLPENANSSRQQPIMVKGNASTIKSLVSKYQGTYRYSAGNISSVAIPMKNLMAFSKESAVERIESGLDQGKGRKFMDSARIYNNVDSALEGLPPLTQQYTGTGVIVGVIDGGLYWHHPDFKRANGNTRVLYLWDQNLTSAPSPAGFTYGAEWDSTGLNNGSCNSKDPASDQGHGTCVTGIAAGNNFSMDTVLGGIYANKGDTPGRYMGVAPDADMIFVNVSTDSNFLQSVTDAVNYIFTRATQLGRPCVINTSVGTYYGSHDGQDLYSQAINNMIEAQNGRVLVAAAGNAGNVPFHLSYPLNANDSLFTWFSYNSSAQEVYFDFWADTAHFSGASFALGCDSISAGVDYYRGRSNYYTVDSSTFAPLQQGVTNCTNADTIWQNGRNMGVYQICVTLSGSTYHTEFYAIPTVKTDLWRLQTLGQGTFDLWASSGLAGTSYMLDTMPTGYSTSQYEFPDTFKTIVSSWQCSDDVITVGNYSNRTAYEDVNDSFIQTGLVDGSLLNNSSVGPTRDGRVKPDIAATGTLTTTTGDSLNIALLMGSGNSSKVSVGGQHVRNGGTSMASPLVCGCAALYLQEHPNASFSEVKQALELTTKQDGFTGSVPNNNWGYGKINCFRALLYNVSTDTACFNYNPLATVSVGNCIPKIYGCTDTASINYDSAANVNNGSCIPKVYGVMDTLCPNYNPLANVNNDSCTLGINQVASDISFDLYPNPFSNSTTIVVNSSLPLTNLSVRFYDMVGRQVDALAFPQGSNQVTYTNTKLAAGLYDAAIVSGNKVIANRTVVVE